MWLREQDGANSLWSGTSRQNFPNGLVVMDRNLKERITKNGDCLGLIYRNSETNNVPSFKLTSWSCDAKTTVVCEKALPRHFEPPKFPCISQLNSNKRRKREESGMSQFNTDFNSDSKDLGNLKGMSAIHGGKHSNILLKINVSALSPFI